MALYALYGYYGDLFVNFVGWLGILSCIIIGRLFMNKENKITKYFKKSAFPIYILHQTVLVIIGFYTFKMLDNIYLQVCTIIFGSFIVTVVLYEVISKIPVVKKIIGVR